MPTYRRLMPAHLRWYFARRVIRGDYVLHERVLAAPNGDETVILKNRVTEDDA